jgi:enhancing lycopene biosynthesis protein 2
MFSRGEKTTRVARFLRRKQMKHFNRSKNLKFRGAAMVATAIGAAAVGAFAIGALAVGRLVIRRVLIESAEFKSLKIQDLTVIRLHAAEVTVSDSLKVPGGNGDHKVSS